MATTTTPKFRPVDKSRYSDIDLTFAMNPNTGDISFKKDDTSIKQALKNIILTNNYDRPFHPEFGSGVNALLFELASPLTALFIEKKITEVISNYEPRVVIRLLNVVFRLDDNGFDVRLVYHIVNVEEPQTLNFVLEKVR